METPLGKFKRDLEKLLDVQDKNSSFYQIQECVQTCFNDLSEQIRTQEAVKKGVAAERGKGTAKGRDFQEFLTEITDEYAAPLEDKVTFVGDTKGTTNKKGDVLIEINPSNTKEALKHNPLGIDIASGAEIHKPYRKPQISHKKITQIFNQIKSC